MAKFWCVCIRLDHKLHFFWCLNDTRDWVFRWSCWWCYIPIPYLALRNCKKKLTLNNIKVLLCDEFHMLMVKLLQTKLTCSGSFVGKLWQVLPMGGGSWWVFVVRLKIKLNFGVKTILDVNYEVWLSHVGFILFLYFVVFSDVNFLLLFDSIY